MNSQLPLATLGDTIKAHITAGDKAADKAEEHYKAAGIHLLEAKERVILTRGLTWPKFLESHCSIGRRRADELIAIAEGRTSLAEVRANAREGMAKSRAKNPAQRYAQSSEKDQGNQDEDDTDTDDVDVFGIPKNAHALMPSARVRGFLVRANEAVRGANADDLSGLRVTKEMRQAAQAAAEAWKKLATALNRRINAVRNVTDSRVSLTDALDAFDSLNESEQAEFVEARHDRINALQGPLKVYVQYKSAA